MCGRGTFTKKAKALEERFQLSIGEDIRTAIEERLPNYNIAPTHWHPVITNSETLQIQFFRWGLIPVWSKDMTIASRLINARMETITEKPAFKAIHKRRCLVPLDGFYEWKRIGKNKIPYRIILKDQAIFSAAGIWERWKSKQGEPIFSFSILTQPPNAIMEPIHNRMPAILNPSDEHIWLDHNIPAKDVLQLITPYPSEQMEAYTVSNTVGNVRNNTPELIKNTPPKQGTLF